MQCIWKTASKVLSQGHAVPQSRYLNDLLTDIGTSSQEINVSPSNTAPRSRRDSKTMIDTTMPLIKSKACVSYVLNDNQMKTQGPQYVITEIRLVLEIITEIL